MRNLIFIFSVYSKVMAFASALLVICSCNTNDAEKKNASSKWMHLEGNAQGTTFSIKYEGEKDFSKEVKGIFDRMDQQLSTYIDESVITVFNNSQEAIRKLSHNDTLFRGVFKKSKEVYSKSGGAFNPAVMPLVEYWGFSREEMIPDLIDSSKVDSLMEFIDFSKCEYMPTRGAQIQLPEKMQLDFNGIAQGYTVDKIAEMLENNGIKNYMIEVGGEVRAKGKNEREQYWKLGIDKPIDINADHELQAIITLVNRSMATSGNYRKFYEKDGVRYSHTIDPFTGYPVQHSLLSATVLADDCASADAFATAFMVMGVEKTKEFLEKNKNLKLDVYLIFSGENGKFNTWFSKGVKELIDEEI